MIYCGSALHRVECTNRARLFSLCSHIGARMNRKSNCKTFTRSSAHAAFARKHRWKIVTLWRGLVNMHSDPTFLLRRVTSIAELRNPGIHIHTRCYILSHLVYTTPSLHFFEWGWSSGPACVEGVRDVGSVSGAWRGWVDVFSLRI